MKKNRTELYRNTATGKLGGVCAGIADYFGWETWLVRILVVSGVLFGIPFLILGYIAAWFILDVDPKAAEKMTINKFQKTTSVDKNISQASAPHNEDYENESIKVKTRVWQSGEPPKRAFHDIRKKFSSLEKQLQNIEQYVTSSEFTLAREINKL